MFTKHKAKSGFFLLIEPRVAGVDAGADLLDLLDFVTRLLLVRHARRLLDGVFVGD